MWLQQSSSLCFQLPSSTLACRSHLSSLNSAEPAGFLLLHGLVETHLDGSTGPYALLSYCSLHGLSRVQPSLWHLPSHIHYCSSTCDPPECTFTMSPSGWFKTQALHFGHKLQFTIMVSSSPNLRRFLSKLSIFIMSNHQM
jgi:hypothetical protein